MWSPDILSAWKRRRVVPRSPTPSIDLVKIWVNNMHLGCLALCQSYSLFQSDTSHFLLAAIPRKLSTDALKKKTEESAGLQ